MFLINFIMRWIRALILLQLYKRKYFTAHKGIKPNQVYSEVIKQNEQPHLNRYSGGQMEAVLSQMALITNFSAPYSM